MIIIWVHWSESIYTTNVFTHIYVFIRYQTLKQGTEQRGALMLDIKANT